MIRLSKKEAPKQQEDATKSVADTSPAESNTLKTETEDGGGATLSVLGIGGKQLKTGAAKKAGTKKRTPGEIRIQKGLL